MRYFTEELDDLQHRMSLMDGLRKIPDKEYTDAEISTMYKQDLQIFVAEDEEAYNSEPFFLPMEDLLSEESFDPENFLIVNEDTGEMRHPTSPQEARENLEQEYRQTMEEFENRPPYDPTEMRKMFRNMYRVKLKSVGYTYPIWLSSSVNNRLLALDRIPETAYNRLKDEAREARKEYNRIMRNARNAFKRQHIPERMEEALNLHDADLLSLKKVRKDYVMIVNKDGAWPDDDTPYRRVTFKDAIVYEKGSSIRIRKYKNEEDMFYQSNISFICYEMYNDNDGYEVHIMAWTNFELKYLTIKCEEIDQGKLEETKDDTKII